MTPTYVYNFFFVELHAPANFFIQRSKPREMGGHVGSESRGRPEFIYSNDWVLKPKLLGWKLYATDHFTCGIDISRNGSY